MTKQDSVAATTYRQLLQSNVADCCSPSRQPVIRTRLIAALWVVLEASSGLNKTVCREIESIRGKAAG